MYEQVASNKKVAPIENLSSLIKIIEIQLGSVYTKYAVGEIDKKTFEEKIEAFYLGLRSMKAELEELKKLPERIIQHGFYFYKDCGIPLNKAAFSLKDFLAKLKVVPKISIEFHQKRGDFSRWIRDVFGDALLADSVENINERGEELRKKLINTVAEKIYFGKY